MAEIINKFVYLLYDIANKNDVGLGSRWLQENITSHVEIWIDITNIGITCHLI